MKGECEAIGAEVFITRFSRFEHMLTLCIIVDFAHNVPCHLGGAVKHQNAKPVQKMKGIKRERVLACSPITTNEHFLGHCLLVRLLLALFSTCNLKRKIF